MINATTTAAAAVQLLLLLLLLCLIVYLRVASNRFSSFAVEWCIEAPLLGLFIVFIIEHLFIRLRVLLIYG